MKKFVAFSAIATAAVAFSSPSLAQDTAEQQAAEQREAYDLPEKTVFDGDFLAVGAGAGYVPSYTGSDDYVVSPVPAIAGAVGGIDFAPRGSGIALDFLPDADTGPDFSLGVVGKLNLNRTRRIEDPVVEQVGELDTAVEVGPTAGVGFAGVLNPFDRLSISADATWDVAGAHDGMTVSPGISYLTPLSRGAAVSLSLSTQWVDDDYADYYYSVTPVQSAATGGALPAFQAEGGFESYGATLFGGYDLNGDLADGGLAVFAVGGYSRLVNDAKDTPFTRLRGDADQWFAGIGLGYVFGL